MMSLSTLCWIFWGCISFAVAFWHLIYFWRQEALSAQDLEKLSSQFQGIYWDYIKSGGLFLIFLIVPASLLGYYLDDWLSSQYGTRFYPLITLAMSTYGIFQGTFAATKGVYPMGKSISFIYENEQGLRLRQLGRYHIVVSVLTIAVSLVYFCVIVLIFR